MNRQRRPTLYSSFAARSPSFTLTLYLSTTLIYQLILSCSLRSKGPCCGTAGNLKPRKTNRIKSIHICHQPAWGLLKVKSPETVVGSPMKLTGLVRDTDKSTSCSSVSLSIFHISEFSLLIILNEVGCRDLRSLTLFPALEVIQPFLPYLK